MTPRQAEVLALLKRGHSNREIAGRIGTGEPAVKKHVAALMAEFGVGTRVELALATQTRVDRELQAVLAERTGPRIVIALPFRDVRVRGRL